IADADALRGPAQAFAQARRLRRRVAERGDHARPVETEELAGTGRSAEYAAGRGYVPALGVVAGRDGVADPAFDLDTEDESREQLRSGHVAQLGEREQRRRDRCA